MGFWAWVRGFFGSKAARETTDENDEPLVGSAQKAAVPSAEALFRERVIRAAQQLPFITSATPADDFAVDVVNDEGQELRLFLGNVFAETRDMGPEDQDAQIDRFLSLLGDRPETPKNWEDAAPKLLPVIRPTTFFDITIDDKKLERQIAFRPFLPFLSEAIAIDFEGQFQYATCEQLASWGVDTDQAFARARQNLADLDDHIESYDARGPSPIWHVASGDAYESSRIAVPGFLSKLAPKVAGKPVAAIPERSTIVVAGDEHEASIVRLAELAEREFRASPRAISPVLYTEDDAGRVVPFVGEKSSRLADILHANEVLLAATEYETQKASLERALEERDDDVYVASMMVLNSKGQRKTTSLAAWPEHTISLLPFADLVALCGGEPGSDGSWHVMVPWGVVVEHAAHLWVQEPGVDPPRMRTIGWPDADLLEKLKAMAVEL